MKLINKITIPNESLKEKSQVFQKLGIKSEATDLCLCMKDDCSNASTEYWILQKNKIFPFKTALATSRNTEYIKYNIKPWEYHGIRPIIKVNDLTYFIKKAYQNEKGMNEVVFGEFPVTISDENNKLTELDKAKKLNFTGRYFESINLPIYEKDGKRYAKTFSTSTPIYFDVMPLVWYIDIENSLLISKNILFTSKIHNKNFCSFSDTELHQLLNIKFLKDILPKQLLEKSDSLMKRKNNLTTEGKIFEPWEHTIWVTKDSEYEKAAFPEIEGYVIVYGPCVNHITKNGGFHLTAAYRNQMAVLALPSVNRSHNMNYYPAPGKVLKKTV